MLLLGGVCGVCFRVEGVVVGEGGVGVVWVVFVLVVVQYH